MKGRGSKKRKFRAVTEVKAAAREQIGTVPATRVVPDKKKRAIRKAPKHKASLEDLLAEQ